MSSRIEKLTEENRVRLLSIRDFKDDVGVLVCSDCGLPNSISATLEAYKCLGEDTANFDHLLQECCKYALVECLLFELRMAAESAEVVT